MLIHQNNNNNNNKENETFVNYGVIIKQLKEINDVKMDKKANWTKN